MFSKSRRREVRRGKKKQKWETELPYHMNLWDENEFEGNDAAVYRTPVSFLLSRCTEFVKFEKFGSRF